MLELATMGGSALMGFIFKMMANKQENDAKEKQFLLDKAGLDNSNQNDAHKRAGIWMQRFTVLVLITLFAFISLGGGSPTSLITNTDDTSLFFGLLSWSNQPSVQTIDGALYTETLSLSILAIVSYLFGSQTADKS